MGCWYDCVDAWERAGVGPEVIEPILRFMESHPDLDYGAPGPLVHFLETLDGYHRLLFESVDRQPTPHTLSMLNRVINGTTGRVRSKLLHLLGRATHHPLATASAVRAAFRYLDFHLSR